MSETDLIELEEIVFEAPAPGLPVLVNPDVFVEKLLAQACDPTTPTPLRNRIRATIWGKVLICDECVVGQHDGCSEDSCPCIHHDCIPPITADDYCWQI